MRFLIGVFLLWIGAASGAEVSSKPNALPVEALQALGSPTKTVILYSLEPWEQANSGNETLHHFKVLGRTSLDAQRTEVAVDVFRKAVEDWKDPGVVAACFDPRHALRIVSNGHTFDFLLCYKCQGLNVYKDDTLVVSLGASGSPLLLNFLLTDAHVPLSQTNTEDQRAAAQKKQIQNEARWFAAMPQSLQPYWPAMRANYDFKFSLLREPLSRELPDVKIRILKLVEWLGSGAGPWSGFPSYEEAPQELLLDYPTNTILGAIQSGVLNEAQLEGISRFFGSWNFSQARPKDLALLSDSLKEALLAHSLKNADSDKKKRAQVAFGKG